MFRSVLSSVDLQEVLLNSMVTSCCTVCTQMYYEAKSVNTQLIYRYKQLEKVKETLEAAWTEHKRLHQAAGLDVSEVDSSTLQQHHVATSDRQSASVHRELSLCHSVSPVGSKQTGEAGLINVSGEPFTTREVFAVADRPLRRPSTDRRPFIDPTGAQDFDSAASKLPTYIELAGSTATQTFALPWDDRHLSLSPKSTSSSSSPLFCVDDGDMCEDAALLEPGSDTFDVYRRPVNQSALRANNDDDSLESLFGDDDWWATDQSWRWQYSLPASAVDDASQIENA